MDEGKESHQEYDPTAQEPTRVWIFCRDCRCRLQVRMLPRPTLRFACLCGHRGVLADFDVLEQEERARQVAETFEVAYQATKEILSPIMEMKKTRMFVASGAFRALLDAPEKEEAAPETKYAPGPFESEADYQKVLGDLMGALDGAGRHMLTRHEVLTEIADFAFQRRHLRGAARTFCSRACKADQEQIEHLIQWVRQSAPATRLRFPSFRFLIQIYKEAGENKKALAVAVRARTTGMPGFDETIAELRGTPG